MANHQIVITRESAFYGCAISHKVEIDGFSAGVLKNGSSLVINTTAGHHVLSFVSRGKIEKNIPITVDPEDYYIELSAKLNRYQKIEIAANSMQIDTEENKKNKAAALLVLSCFAFLFLFSIILLFDDNDDTAADSNLDGQEVVLTEEDQAEIQLEKATKEFSEGDYNSAIVICDQILSDFPNTSAAKNMTEYLAEQYKQFPHITAKDLVNEYDANIVNADEKYTDEVIVLSGAVSSIEKTNNDTNLAVLLESGTYFYGVQLNFKISHTDEVAKLSAGDYVTVIGRCSGKSGKQLIIFDGNNVMVDNCYFIN